ncbi:YaaR family protein [Aneurinibacillus tyrosinisolvens]|uniref:YaaR family protein n=1 Tax=Aneurinibacillus tyrosinisolvens TaxID=1443435 RepID=UPI000AFD0A5D|nr:YaaR family protein [Aneurinibacillus tyrosinisolvens]
MRIGENMPIDKTPGIEPKQKVLPQYVDFDEVMHSRSRQLDVDNFNKLIEKIDMQGERLARSRTIKDLKEYKSLVKNFMEEAVKNGVAMEERHGFSRRGRSKVYKIITEVDKKLTDVTNAVIDKEQKAINILDTIGEIKGLLVNMYM